MRPGAEPVAAGAPRRPDDAQAAVELWAEVRGCRAPVGRVTILKESGGSRVYRLAEVDSCGRCVIARRRTTVALAGERLIHEFIAGVLPSAVSLYASVEVGEFTWQFWEDAGREHYVGEDPEHAAALADWLAGVHATFNGPSPVPLPDHGPGRYLEHVLRGRELLREGGSNRALTSRQRSLVDGYARLLDDVAAIWPEAAAVCASWQPTLVHGDLQPKNILIRRAGGRLCAVPIDWELGGWGIPAADLGTLLWSAPPAGQALLRYRDARFGPGGDDADVPHFAAVGLVFRLVAAIEWMADRLRSPWPGTPLATLELYAHQLRGALRMTGISATSLRG